MLFVGFALSPESPSYFAKKGKYEESKKALSRLRGLPIESQEIEEAFEAIKARQLADSQLGDSTYRELFSMKDRLVLSLLPSSRDRVVEHQADPLLPSSPFSLSLFPQNRFPNPHWSPSSGRTAGHRYQLLL